jgi:hypothetical protein
MRVKVMVQGYAHALVRSSPVQYVFVLGPLHADLADMNRVQSVLAKDRRCMRSKALVEQNAFHATLSTLNRSSSTAAAA